MNMHRLSARQGAVLFAAVASGIYAVSGHGGIHAAMPLATGVTVAACGKRIGAFRGRARGTLPAGFDFECRTGCAPRIVDAPRGMTRGCPAC